MKENNGVGRQRVSSIWMMNDSAVMRIEGNEMEEVAMIGLAMKIRLMMRICLDEVVVVVMVVVKDKEKRQGRIWDLEGCIRCALR